MTITCNLCLCQLYRTVLLEVPHFASTEDGDREVFVARSENGVNWVEHTALSSEDTVHNVIGPSFEGKTNANKSEKFNEAQFPSS